MLHSLDFSFHPAQPRGMPPDMRRLIDEAVAAGRVTRVPMGVSGLPVQVWNGYELVPSKGRQQSDIEACERARKARNTEAVRPRVPPRQSAVDARAEIINVMIRQGRTRQQITDAFPKISADHLITQINKVRASMGLPPEPKLAGGNMPDLGRIEAVAGLMRDGLRRGEIARRLGLSVDQTERAMRRVRSGKWGDFGL